MLNMLNDHIFKEILVFISFCFEQYLFKCLYEHNYVFGVNINIYNTCYLYFITKDKLIYIYSAFSLQNIWLSDFAFSMNINLFLSGIEYNSRVL
jgi:hypothetical protein